MLAALDARARDDHAVRRECCEGERGRFGVVRARRDAPHVRGRNDEQFRHGAGPVLSKDAETRTERLLAGDAVLAGAVADARVDDYVIARCDGGDAAPDGFHDAGSIGAEDPPGRDGNAWQPLQQVQVEVVKSSGAHANAHVGGCRELGRGEIVAEFDLLQATVRGDGECSHASAPGYICSGMLCDVVRARKSPCASPFF
jgi:hypothetical protein